MAWRCGLSSLDSVITVAFSSRKDFVKNYRVHPTHCLISTQEPGAPLVCCNYFNLLMVTLGLAQFDEAVALLVKHSPRRKDEMSRLRIVVEARAKASPDSLATICVLIFGEGWTSRRGAYSEPCEVNASIDKRQLFQVHFGVSFFEEPSTRRRRSRTGA